MMIVIIIQVRVRLTAQKINVKVIGVFRIQRLVIIIQVGVRLTAQKIKFVVGALRIQILRNYKIVAGVAMLLSEIIEGQHLTVIKDNQVLIEGIFNGKMKILIMKVMHTAVSLEIKSNTETEVLGVDLHIVMTHGVEIIIVNSTIMGLVRTIDAHHKMIIVVITVKIASRLVLCTTDNGIIPLDYMINMHYLNIMLQCLKKQDLI